MGEERAHITCKGSTGRKLAKIKQSLSARYGKASYTDVLELLLKKMPPEEVSQIAIKEGFRKIRGTLPEEYSHDFRILEDFAFHLWQMKDSNHRSTLLKTLQQLMEKE